MKFRKRFVIGDIHGISKKLIDVIKLSGFDNEKDLLISLGDLSDRGEDSWGVVEFLLQIKNLVLIKGNHDSHMRNWLYNKNTTYNWLYNGGQTSIDSYIKNNMNNKDKHLEFYDSALPYYIMDNKCFLHGGLNPDFLVSEHSEEFLYCDRTLPDKQISYETPLKFKDGFEEVYIGHTPTICWHISTPIIKNNVINVDTGCGKGGLLTILDIDTKEYFQA